MAERSVFSSRDDLRENAANRFLSKGFPNGLQINHYTEIPLVYMNNKPYTLTWAGGYLKTFPGCCGLLVSYHAHVHPDFQGYGFGDYLHKERLSIAKDGGYSCVICTVTSKNEAEKHILEKNDWKLVHTFNNKRIKNDVEIWVKDI